MAKLQFTDLSVVLLLLTLQLAGSAWILEVQLHNFSNPRKARYDPQLSKYCCCDCPINCQKDLDSLFCNKCILDPRHNCDPSFLFCLYYNESIHQCVQSKIYFTDYTTILQFSSQSNLFPTLKIIENDKKPDENLLLNVSVKEHDQHNTQFLDYINISLPFKQSSSFSSPTSYNGVYGVCSMTLAYRFMCGKNYFGDNCDVYCSDDKEKEGNFACDSTGNKICYEFENGTCSDSYHYDFYNVPKQICKKKNDIPS